MIRLFVAVGNPTQPFDRMLRMVAEATSSLEVGGLCQHGVSSVRVEKLENRAFVDRTEFEHEISLARVAVIHAGVGTIASAARFGLRPIVVCRRARHGEHADDHQVEIADALEKRGQIVVVDTVEAMRTAILDASASERHTQVNATSPEVLSAIARALEGPGPPALPGARLLIGVMARAVPMLRPMTRTPGEK